MNSVALGEHRRTSFRSLARSFIHLASFNRPHAVSRVLYPGHEKSNEKRRERDKMSHTIKWMLDATEIIAEYEIKDAKWESMKIVDSSAENH